MARKNGCPFSVRDWVIEILSHASTAEDPIWLRIKGLTSMDWSVDSDTEDGSSADNAYSDPYKTKINGSLSIEGKPATDAVTGNRDPGQAELDYYKGMVGCDGDARIRLIDPYGRAQILDVAVTGSGRTADETSDTVSWDMEVVGEPEEVPYVQVTAISTTPASSATVTVGSTTSVTVKFTPTGASNQKYSVASQDQNKVKVANIDGLNFDLVGVDATSDPVNVVVKSMNNAKSATIAVTVSAAGG